MDSQNKIYRDLQKYLDRLPGGFPATESDLDISLLKRLFTLEEAKIAMQLSMKPEPLKTIYHRIKKTGMSIEELREVLDQMIREGTVVPSEEGYNEKHYSSAGFSAGGIYTVQVDRLSKDLINDYRKYMGETRPKGKSGPKKLPMLRTIPVEKSIPLPEKYKVNNYDNVRNLIANARGKIAVANCICRQGQDILGQSCTKTDLHETCFMIGPDHAKHYVDMGIGRYITQEEAFEILEKAQKSGLVLQPENSQRPEAICCCCGDCCVVLTRLKKYPRPADLYETNYYVEVIPELCTGCQECIELCQLEARSMINGVAAVNLDRCIGCGNCVVICSSKANHLRKNDNEILPPKDKKAFNMKALTGKVRIWNMLRIRTKMLLGLKA